MELPSSWSPVLVWFSSIGNPPDNSLLILLEIMPLSEEKVPESRGLGLWSPLLKMTDKPPPCMRGAFLLLLCPQAERWSAGQQRSWKLPGAFLRCGGGNAGIRLLTAYQECAYLLSGTAPRVTFPLSCQFHCFYHATLKNPYIYAGKQNVVGMFLLGYIHYLARGT